MTDGKIFDSLVEKFASQTPEVGLHNKACVVIVFGDTRRGRPATCDISVGIAVYAMVPDCLFLFHDIPTGIVRIMQAKGRFKQLLPVTGKQRPKLIVTMYTAWAELPRTSYEDLFNIELGMIRTLERDEMALENGLIVNLPDMLAGKVDEATMEQVVRNRDNLKSIALAHKSRGTGKDLAAWLKAQMKPLPKKMTLPQDINNAYQAVNELLEALRKNVPEDKLEYLRDRLRSAHESNMRDFWRKRAEDEDQESVILHTNTRLKSHAMFLTKGQSKSTSDTSEEEVRESRNETFTVGRCGYDSADGRKTPDACPRPTLVPTLVKPQQDALSKTKKNSHRSRRRPRFKDSPSERSSVISFEGESEPDPILLPGYKRQHPVDEFKGRCMLCHSSSVLTLLLKSAPPVKTDNFPSEGKNAKLAFPLAMGNFAEMDVVSFFLSCDACTSHLLQIGTCPNGDVIIGALCLVCLPENQGVWLEAVDHAVRGRFDIADLMAICVAIIEAKLVKNEARDALPADKDLFRDCAEWTLRQLTQILDVPATLSPTFSDGKGTAWASLMTIFLTKHFPDPGHVENTELLLLRYPIPGFMVLLRLLSLSNLRTKQAQILLFQRVIFQVMEQYIARRMSAMPPVAVANMLGLTDGTESTSAFRDPNSFQPNGKASVPIMELVECNLLSSDDLERLENLPEFETVKTLGGPAIAVFLHKLLRDGRVYPTAVRCFNAFKVIPAMRTAIHTPLAIGSGLAADMISQLWK